MGSGPGGPLRESVSYLGTAACSIIQQHIEQSAALLIGAIGKTGRLRDGFRSFHLTCIFVLVTVAECGMNNSSFRL